MSNKSIVSGRQSRKFRSISPTVNCWREICVIKLFFCIDHLLNPSENPWVELNELKLFLDAFPPGQDFLSKPKHVIIFRLLHIYHAISSAIKNFP